MPVALTETAIGKAIKTASEKGRVELSDAACPGLRLRISGKSSRTWVLACRDAKGRMRRFPIGSYPDMGVASARTAARALHVEVKVRGADPIAEKRSARIQVGASVADLRSLLDIYGEKVGARQRTWLEARKRVEGVFRQLLKRPLPELTRQEFQIVADRYSAVMSAAAAVRYLRPILKWGTQRGYVLEGVAALHPPAPIKRRRRVLTNEELVKVLPAVRTATRPAWRVMYFIALTLCRREEASRARWSDIDWRSGAWTIADTKNGEPHTVPLSRQAFSFLNGMRPIDDADDGIVFAMTCH